MSLQHRWEEDCWCTQVVILRWSECMFSSHSYYQSMLSCCCPRIYCVGSRWSSLAIALTSTYFWRLPVLFLLLNRGQQFPQYLSMYSGPWKDPLLLLPSPSSAVESLKKRHRQKSTESIQLKKTIFTPRRLFACGNRERRSATRATNRSLSGKTYF